LADWTEEQRRQFSRHLQSQKDQQEREARTPDVGDLVETPDERRWTVTGRPTPGALDLANDEGEALHSVPRDLVRVVNKA
jgi:hypothetical protein